MAKKNVSSDNHTAYFCTGIVLFILSFILYRQGDSSSGFFTFVGALFLLSSIISILLKRKKKTKGIPPAQSGELHEAKPEVSSERPAVQEPESFETADYVDADETEQRREELKSLYEAGIISKEEYRERIKKFHRG